MLSICWVGPMRFCRTEVDRVPASVPGVYLLHAYAPQFGGYPVFYVGKSTDLHRRLCEHLEGKRTKAVIARIRRSTAAYFSAAAVYQHVLLDPLESGLISLLRPPCNDQIPTARPLFVKLPPLMAFVPEEDQWL